MTNATSALPVPLHGTPQALPFAEGKEVQFNFRVADTLKAAFLAAADGHGTNGTEVLTRFMESYIRDSIGEVTLHLDGTACPISTLVVSLSNAVLAKIASDGTLNIAAQNAIFRAGQSHEVNTP